jgi:hypothetical protein
VPLPQYKATWYAESPYRALILRAENANNDFQHAQIDYRQSGAELPEAAAMVGPSASGDDPVFGRMDRQHQDLEDYRAHAAAQAAAADAAAREERQHRRDLLSHMYKPQRAHPMIEAHHQELADAGVEHHIIPGEKIDLFGERHKPREAEIPLGIGLALLPQLPTFQSLNDVHGHPDPAHLGRSMAERTYEHMRQEAFLRAPGVR